MELYAKKITSVPNKENEPSGGGSAAGGAAGAGGNDEEQEQQPAGPASAADVAKAYRDIVHSHEVGAHAKDNVATNWLDPDTGLQRVKHERKLQSSFLSPTTILLSHSVSTNPQQALPFMWMLRRHIKLLPRLLASVRFAISPRSACLRHRKQSP